MNCTKIDILDLKINEKYLYPFFAIFGLCMTYFGNKFIKPTLFISGTIVSSTSSFKLTEFVLKELKYDNCNILYIVMLICSLSGGFLFLKLYNYMNFFIGFGVGSSLGYMLYTLWLHNYCLGVYFILDTMLWLNLLIPGLISGFIVHKKEKELSMLLTSIIGPILVVIPLQELIEKKSFLDDHHLLQNLVYLCIYGILTFSGFYIQYKREKNKRQINYLNNNFQVTV